MKPYLDAPTSAGPGRTALLLVNLGTPDAPTAGAVKRYLSQFLHDHRVVELTRWLWCPLLHFIILPLRSPRVARNYASIWMDEGSPLLVHTRNLARAMQHALPDVSVRVAMRYGNPSIPDVLRELQAEGMQRLLVLPLYPQYSASTSGSVLDAVGKELAGWRRTPDLRFIADYHLDGGWLDALEARVRAHWDLHGRADQLLMSFHGLPKRYETAGDPYPRQCEAGARALAGRLGLAEGEWRLTYQSRFGREEWLQPYTDKTLEAMAREGVMTVDVICPGFAADCLETLEEIAVENDQVFRAAGGQALRYISALNDEPGHVAALSALARSHLQGWPH
ncbi:ferrochelatase [Arenimonas caeni]|jgi:ferrochelatase|uniref:Ferrochelatase n=1 Tax=Arenimonas caeni TaxID=2058085 RepID=A0A2P6M6Z1_9GAMM|nr:ferrochelatase [Arenimonas caeni]MDY0020866.1 ferrochelatase [Arenimonas caeni]PRH81740.1 ferrochelatase [Arenimonas caeni]